MNRLASALASIVREKVRQAKLGRAGTNLESRVLFHGPPLELLDMVYVELASQDGIPAQTATGETTIIPVLLQVPLGQPGFSNPGIGKSGKCDETHLLDLRNVPPCQHSNRSVSSTTDEFGVCASNNASHTTFDEWWGDEFIQHLLTDGLSMAGFQGDQQEEAKSLVENSARAMDEVDPDKETRKAAWRLLSRVFSVQDGSGGLSKAQALSLACGLPPRQDETVTAKIQLGVSQQIAEALADGFKAGIDRVRLNAKEEDAKHLDDFLTHIQRNCKIPTAFERATPAFYLPADTLVVEPPPSWWKALTV